jgi:hypothetical protein
MNARRPVIRDGAAFASASDFLPRSRPEDMVRAGGDCVCAQCGEPYRRHAHDPYESDASGEPWLTVLCDGRRVKL